LLLPMTIRDTKTIVIPIASCFIDNTTPRRFPFAEFILFLERFYVAQLKWPTLPSSYESGDLFFQEREVLPTDFLRILFFVKETLCGSAARLLRYIAIADLAVESLYFIAEFFSCPAWLSDASASDISGPCEVMLSRMRGELMFTASVCPTMEWTQHVIAHWASGNDFPKVESALYLNSAVTSDSVDARQSAATFLSRSLSRHFWGTPNSVVSIFHFFLIDAERVCDYIIDEWRQISSDTIHLSSLFARRVAQTPRFGDFAMLLTSITLRFHLPIWQDAAAFFEHCPDNSAYFFFSHESAPAPAEFFARAVCRSLLPRVATSMQGIRPDAPAGECTPFVLILRCVSGTCRPSTIPLSECDWETFRFLVTWSIRWSELWPLHCELWTPCWAHFLRGFEDILRAKAPASALT
jgi:hypothetical protein